MRSPWAPNRLITLAAILVAAATTWLLGRPLSEVQRTRRHFAELQQQIARATASKAERATARGRAMRLRAQARAAEGSRRAEMNAAADTIERSVEWGDESAVRAVLLGDPMVSMTRRTQLTDFPEAAVERGDGCIACHVSVASPGFDAYPPPFRTHSSLASYVGAASPHPPSRVDCIACHRGDEFASTFTRAGHSTLTEKVADAARVRRSWVALSDEGAMLPVGRTEAGCATCHLGETLQPGAPDLNEGLALLDRGGCYACHDLPSIDPSAKRGPDLRRIRGKLSPEWVRAWIANPRGIKPATWMPRFWSTPDAVDLAAIDAVTAYLFFRSEPFAPLLPAPPAGDAERGRRLVESVGCLGCHIVGDTAREVAGVRRTYGQPLQGIAGKVSAAWLVDWLRDPTRYSPATRMPNLRLSLDEAADAAAYIETLRGIASAHVAADRADDVRIREVIERYALPPDRAGVLGATGDGLRIAAGKAVIASLGCDRCHAIAGFDQRPATAPLRSRPVWRDVDAGVHAGVPAPVNAEPIIELRPAEQRRLALALTSVAGDARESHALTTPWHLARVRGRALVQERNCVGCHEMEGTGGDFARLVAEPTLGPPLLTPEGARVQPAWLRGFLHRPTTIRPWLSVRMPTFGLSGDETDIVSNYLRAIAPEHPKEAPAPPDVTAATGKQLFELLKCQQCHVLGTIPGDQPTANLAPDLRLARERLQPEWILAWLRDPGAILPGTRMPTFWPDYPKSFYDPLEKDGAKQVRAIREHLLNLR